jgi:hypothetical protein
MLTFLYLKLKDKNSRLECRMHLYWFLISICTQSRPVTVVPKYFNFDKSLTVLLDSLHVAILFCIPLKRHELTLDFSQETARQNSLIVTNSLR